MLDCKHPKSVVTDSRHRQGYKYRRRECKICGERYNTIEVIVADIMGKGQDVDSALSFIKTKHQLDNQQHEAIEALLAAFKK